MSENFFARLARLGRREGSLIMRVDLKNPFDATYVLPKLKIHVQVLN